MTVRVMVVDDHPVVRDGVTLLLRSDPSLVLVGTAEAGRAALERVEELRPDLVLLDLRLPDMLAPEVISGLRQKDPGVRVVVFTAHGDHQGVIAALEAGANGCLLKDVAGTDLVSGLRRVLRGERVVDPRIMPDAAYRSDALARSGLTRREYEVIRLAAQGRTNPEIAESTGLTRNTVKTYLQSALHKLGARNRVEAIGKASEAGLL
ncbi:DNA-binding response regulator, NarL/FixJ family, contains REC and HTH domains [Amycolatopsis arida]|uniref:DNA-binding response regulator, NarL/FixJ family, contains REC and HTH domains n=1 Tax=Amycolatopsis arida TaxID=587909 RepID=A0A1I5SBY3_9PSEU|nr:response regulator transcription factor [Amycolatopsis arida]TDX96526.1 DNA-binding NarL/FixJ family response regulator [Amycolatopsis arida]SFP68298.1 DNA-binding response regulator, NarL/FixJ family, contains REC and HTH domains [Amycolatopsis arida]